MKPRFAERQLTDLLAQFPAVVLLGPRQAGKTTLAMAETERRGDALYLDLELLSAQRQMDDPEAFLLAHTNRLVILDEVQRMPELFAVLRCVIDIRRRAGEAAGQFLLLGSASGALLRQASESLSGRIAQLELTPFQARELLQADAAAGDLNPLWVRGGFPLSWLAPDDAASLRWREAFIATYLERDIPALGHPPGTATWASGWYARPRFMCATAASFTPCSARLGWNRYSPTRSPGQVGKASSSNNCSPLPRQPKPAFTEPLTARKPI